MPTNAVAATILSVQFLLPAFTHFAERAGLDVRLPLTEQRITKSKISERPGNQWVMAVFDGHHQFFWNVAVKDPYRGQFYYYDNSNAVSRFRGPALRELLDRESLISTNEAREIAERCLKSLGYDLKKVKAGPPRVAQWTSSREQGGEHLPLPAFHVEWFPKGVKEPDWHVQLIEIEVSGLTKKVTFFTSSPQTAGATEEDIRKLTTNSIPR